MKMQLRCLDKYSNMFPKWKLSGNYWCTVSCTMWSSNASSTCRKAEQQFPCPNVLGNAGVSDRKTDNQVQEMKSINHANPPAHLSKLYWCWHLYFTPIIIPSDKANSSSAILICIHFPEPLVPALTFSKIIYLKGQHFQLEVNSKLLTSRRYNPNFHLVYSQQGAHSLPQRARSLLKLKSFALHEISGFRQCNYLCIYTKI